MISAAIIATIIYLILTLVALISIISPVLQSISSHGKTRTLTSTIINNTQHEHKKFIHQRLLYFVLSSPRLTVNKCRFIDFYTIGIITTISRLSHTIISYYYDTDIITSCVNKQQLVVPILLLLIHLFRRYCECKWVQKSTSSTSYMHLAGYLLGILHYICLPFILIPHHTLFICTTNDDEYRDCNGAKSFNIQQSTLLEICSIIGCLYFQYQQYRHHVLLANLRKKIKKFETYSIPIGGWFEYISCPHYFSEIMIYVIFALLVHGNITDLTEQWNSTQTLFGDATLYTRKHWILLLWVTTNLSISANRNHQWYIDNFRETYPQHRKRLIPFVW